MVDVSVAGGNYGYSLMWVLVVALLMRFLFVSLIARARTPWVPAPTGPSPKRFRPSGMEE